MQFSSAEIRDITKSWLAVSAIFAIAFTGVLHIFSEMFLIVLVSSAITAGLGFILHEMAHKFVAQKWGARAEFRAFDMFLIIGFFLALFGTVFVLPGAVFIEGIISRKRNGLISLAGPGANAVLALIFLFVSIAVPGGIVQDVSRWGAQINFWLALFNLLPFWNIDGAKVLAWSKPVWAISFLVSIVAVFLTT